MSRRGRGQQSEARPYDASTFDGSSEVFSIFQAAAEQLTERQDRHEKFVKLSRDVTIESKRIIFLLHSAVSRGKVKGAIIVEAKDRFAKLVDGPIKSIALEMENVPAYLHHKAITAGFQEYVEARTFLSFLEKKQIVSVEDVRKELTFTIKSEEDGSERILTTFLPMSDYMLGLADLSGEIMRTAINAISSGNERACTFACDINRTLYIGFLGLFGVNAVFNNKLKTTVANVTKIENALFAYKVRGREAIPPMPHQISPPRTIWGPADDDDQGLLT